MKKSLLYLLFIYSSINAKVTFDFPRGWYAKGKVGAFLPTIVPQPLGTIGTFEKSTVDKKHWSPFFGPTLGVVWKKVPNFGPELGALRISLSMYYSQKNQQSAMDYYTPEANPVLLKARSDVRICNLTNQYTYILFATKKISFSSAIGWAINFSLKSPLKLYDQNNLYIGQRLETEKVQPLFVYRATLAWKITPNNLLTFNYVFSRGHINFNKKVYQDPADAHAQHVNGGLLVPAPLGVLPTEPRFKYHSQSFHIGFIHDFGF